MVVRMLLLIMIISEILLFRKIFKNKGRQIFDLIFNKIIYQTKVNDGAKPITVNILSIEILKTYFLFSY